MPAVALSDIPQRLLVIDRDADLAEILSGAGIARHVHHVDSGRDGAAVLQHETYDVILADLASVDDLDRGAEAAVTRLARLGASALLIVVSGSDSVSAAVGALQAGAHDCIARPFSAQDLGDRIAVLHTRHDRHAHQAFSARAVPGGTSRFIARAPRMQVVLDHLQRIAHSPAPVFLSGERGTGKLLAAETLHALGPHAGQPFVAMDCTAPESDEPDETLDEGLCQLAGTAGARALTKAGGGTLYLREIGALGAAGQARLLSFVEPDAPGPIELRIVCGTARARPNSPGAAVCARTCSTGSTSCPSTCRR